jgi:hypothetical protein
MFRYKTVIGWQLDARALSNQRTETKVGGNVLNRMTALGIQISLFQTNDLHFRFVGATDRGAP